ncbi:SH3 domain-containing protein [candidate division KSB1 bacterium]
MIFSLLTSGKLLKTAFIILILLFTAISVSVHAQTQQSAEWSSYTMTGVNLRASASQQSDRISTLETWTRITVIGESDGWVEIRLEDGQTGWVASNYVIPRDIVAGLTDEIVQAEVARRMASISTDTTEESGFTTRAEPSNVAELTESNGGASNYVIVTTFLLGISIILNMVLFFKMKSSSGNGELITDTKKFQQDYNLLKKENHDLKDQIEFADNKYAELEKSLQKNSAETKLQKDLHEQELNKQKNRYNILEDSFKKYEKNLKALDEHIGKLKQENSILLKENESINQKLGETSENIQEKIVKYTMAEQAHKEENIRKQNDINSLQSRISEMKLMIQQLEDELVELKGLREKEKKEFEKAARSLEQKLNEKEQIINIAVEKEREKLSVELEEKYSKRMADEKRMLAEKFEIEKQNILVESESLSLRNIELEKIFKDKETALNKEIKSREELEKKVIETQKQIIEKEPEEDRPGIQAFEDLKRDHEQLLATFQEKKKVSDSAENAWKEEKKKYLSIIQELEDRLLEAEKAEKEEEEEVIVEKKPIEIKEAEPVPSEAVSEIKKPEEYKQYVHSFFTQIKKL